MKSPSLRLVSPCLLSLSLSGCGDETEPAGTAPADVAWSHEVTLSAVGKAPESGLTPEELAVEPGAAVPRDPTTEQVEPGDPDPTESENVDLGSGPVTELDWDALIPAEWQPDKIMEQFNAEELEDDDPRAQELLNRLLALWKESPVVEDLDGKRVKLPGFVVPLDTDGQKIREFLLVPYYGACIHVPPPPANQTVHVVTGTDRKYQGGLFDPVWVSGILKVEASSSDLAEAGYRMDAIKVEPYE